MLKNIGLFCKRALQKRPVFCKETCIFKHPTHRSHPIAVYAYIFYDVATISRLPESIGLFCKRALSKRLCSANETYDFKEPTTCSHPIHFISEFLCLCRLNGKRVCMSTTMCLNICAAMHTYMHIGVYWQIQQFECLYGVAASSRLLKIIGLVCRT